MDLLLCLRENAGVTAYEPNPTLCDLSEGPVQGKSLPLRSKVVGQLWGNHKLIACITYLVLHHICSSSAWLTCEPCCSGAAAAAAAVVVVLCLCFCSVVQASQSLVNNFVGLTQALPGIGRRLQEVQGIENQGEGGKRVAHPWAGGGGCLPILRGGVGVKPW